MMFFQNQIKAIGGDVTKIMSGTIHLKKELEMERFEDVLIVQIKKFGLVIMMQQQHILMSSLFGILRKIMKKRLIIQ